MRRKALVRERRTWGAGCLPFCFVAIIGVYGCSADPTGLGRLSNVTGEVTFNGEPTPGAIVEFVPKDEAKDGKLDTLPVDAPRTFAVVKEDGTFEVNTVVPEGLKKGASPGEYLISITWTKPVDPNDKDSSQGPDLLPIKYKSVTTSELEFEVKAGTNTIPPFTIVP